MYENKLEPVIPSGIDIHRRSFCLCAFSHPAHHLHDCACWQTLRFKTICQPVAAKAELTGCKNFAGLGMIVQACLLHVIDVQLSLFIIWPTTVWAVKPLSTPSRSAEPDSLLERCSLMSWQLLKPASQPSEPLKFSKLSFFGRIFGLLHNEPVHEQGTRGPCLANHSMTAYARFSCCTPLRFAVLLAELSEHVSQFSDCFKISVTVERPSSGLFNYSEIGLVSC